MILGIFLSSGESFQDLAKNGQDVRFKKYYVESYSKFFEKVYVFSYAKEHITDLPKNVFIIPNKFNLNRYLYGVIMPVLNYRIILECDVFRAFHLLGSLPGIISKVVFNKPFVYNYGYDYIRFSQLESKYWQVIFVFILRPIVNIMASKIIGVTKSVFKFIPKNKLVYIPNGVDTNLFKPMYEKRNGKIIIFSVGRLEKQKNYINLIKALKNVNIKLVLIGQGSLKKDLIYLAKKEKIELKLIENVPHIDLPKYYRLADIFILPSIEEGFSKVLIEAMACGLPVICSKVGGANEVIKDGKNGIFCQVTKDSIREKILLLLRDKNLRGRLGKNARNSAVDNYDIKKLIKKELEILNEIKAV